MLNRREAVTAFFASLGLPFAAKAVAKNEPKPREWPSNWTNWDLSQNVGWKFPEPNPNPWDDFLNDMRIPERYEIRFSCQPGAAYLLAISAATITILPAENAQTLKVFNSAEGIVGYQIDDTPLVDLREYGSPYVQIKRLS